MSQGLGEITLLSCLAPDVVLFLQIQDRGGVTDKAIAKNLLKSFSPTELAVGFALLFQRRRGLP